uniref:von Willebrand factor D and EGF domain-containing protein n=1 Tax=Cacopsylla melanoneura TaxID=428564 RepID=A0A8D9A5Z6_9HEMI
MKTLVLAFVLSVQTVSYARTVRVSGGMVRSSNPFSEELNGHRRILPGEGVCTKMIKVPKTRRVIQEIPYEERYLDMDCYFKTYHTSNCYRTREKQRKEYITENYTEDEEIRVCCTRYTLRGNKCEPECETDCVYGSCVSPGNCVCNPGYVLANESDPNVCEPHCKICINGVCSAPDVCDCFYDYQPSEADSNICLPTCSPECINGFCNSPHQCTCLSGYRRVNATACEPVCSLPCQGICTGPDECTCNDNHIQVNQTHCQPRCDTPCMNGVCVAPNTCACIDNYEKEDNFTCRPSCDTPCINAICSDVNKCSCSPGYDQVNSTYCSPICSTPCKNSQCASPDYCACDSGYDRVNSSHCKPHCTSCTQGTCIAPDECKCGQGFAYNITSGDCHRRCAEVCSENGICKEDNTCVCPEGDPNSFCHIPCPDNYTLNPRTLHCEPDCTTCTGGTCYQPNVCSCPYNYHVENGSCVINEQYRAIYSELVGMYMRKEVFIACRYEVERNTGDDILAVDVTEWSMETYKVIRCKYGAGQNETKPCEPQCDLKLVKLQGGDVSQPVVSINCTLYNDKSEIILNGSIQCSATSIVSTSKARTSQSPSSTNELSSTNSQHPHPINDTSSSANNNTSIGFKTPVTADKTNSTNGVKAASPTTKRPVMGMQGSSENVSKGPSSTNERPALLANMNSEDVSGLSVVAITRGTAPKASNSSKLIPGSRLKTQQSWMKKVWYQCAEVTLNNTDEKSNRIVRVFMRYFVEKKENTIDMNERGNNRSELNEDPTERQSLQEHERNDTQVEDEVDSKDGRQDSGTFKGDISSRLRENTSLAISDESMCPVMCPSEHLTTSITLIDGTQFLAPIVSCFEGVTDTSSSTPSAFTFQIEVFAPYLIAAAVVSLLVLLVASVRYYTTARQVFYVKGRGYADGAVEESEEAFNLAGSCSEITTVSTLGSKTEYDE